MLGTLVHGYTRESGTILSGVIEAPTIPGLKLTRLQTVPCVGGGRLSSAKRLIAFQSLL